MNVKKKIRKKRPIEMSWSFLWKRSWWTSTEQKKLWSN